MKLEGLSAVNVLVGGNNSGKTSVLEAIALYARPTEIRTWVRIAQQRDLRPSQEIESSEYVWLFGGNPDQSTPDVYPIALEGTMSGHDHTVVAGCVPISGTVMEPSYIRDDEGEVVDVIERQLAREGVELKVRIDNTPDEVFTIWLDARERIKKQIPSPNWLPTRTITPFGHRVERPQIRDLSEATKLFRKEEISKLLSEIDPLIVSLEILSSDGKRASLSVQHKDLGMVPIGVFGDGIRRIVAMALAIPSASNGVLLIDEIETAIHKSALSKVFSWLVAACRQYNVQLFATTHSLEALDAIMGYPQPNTEEFTLYRIFPEGNPDRVQRMDADLVRRLRANRGLDVR